MGRSGSKKTQPNTRTNSDHSRDIDARYGLDPVFEPAEFDSFGDVPEGVQARSVQCPYCGESFETLLDLSSGNARYIEDCTVCCRPIEFVLGVDSTGALAELSVLRSD